VATKRIERIELGDGSRVAGPDELVEEAPLRIVARGEDVAVTMRTPGADVELVRGLMFAEGVRCEPRQVDEDVVEVDAEVPRRSFMATAACGLCGKVAIAALEARAATVTSDLIVAAAILARVPETLRAAQRTFEQTGGLHGAGILDAGGRLLAAREDVGRHNALDKVIGWALGAGAVPLSAHIVAVSGRLGYELIEKVVLAGAPIVVAVSAPSQLAVDVAERFGVAVVGFARGTRLNVYSHGWRVKGP
jgi:FdhD protein